MGFQIKAKMQPHNVKEVTASMAALGDLIGEFEKNEHAGRNRPPDKPYQWIHLRTGKYGCYHPGNGKYAGGGCGFNGSRYTPGKIRIIKNKQTKRERPSGSKDRRGKKIQ